VIWCPACLSVPLEGGGAACSRPCWMLRTWRFLGEDARLDLGVSGSGGPAVVRLGDRLLFRSASIPNWSRVDPSGRDLGDMVGEVVGWHAVRDVLGS